MDNDESNSDTISVEPFVEDHDLLDFEPGDDLMPYHPQHDTLLSESCDLEQGGASSPPSLGSNCIFTSIPIKSEPIEPLFVEKGVLIDITESTSEEEINEIVVPVYEVLDSGDTQAGTTGLASASPGGPLKSPTVQIQPEPQPGTNPPPITASTTKPRTRKRKRLRIKSRAKPKTVYIQDPTLDEVYMVKYNDL